MQVKFSWSWVELVKPTAHARACSTAGRKCAFLEGSWADCPGDLRNLWAEQLIVAQDCTILGLSSPAGRNCAIFWIMLDWQNCAILEPSRLTNIIVQFVEGRLVAIQNCAISWGSYSTYSWTKSGEIACEGNASRFDRHASFLQENNWILCTWRSKICCYERLVGRLQIEAKVEFLEGGCSCYNKFLVLKEYHSSCLLLSWMPDTSSKSIRFHMITQSSILPS